MPVNSTGLPEIKLDRNLASVPFGGKKGLLMATKRLGAGKTPIVFLGDEAQIIADVRSGGTVFILRATVGQEIDRVEKALKAGDVRGLRVTFSRQEES